MYKAIDTYNVSCNLIAEYVRSTNSVLMCKLFSP